MTSDILFESPRLLFRRIVMDDASAVFEMNSNPEVVKYTGNFVHKSVEDSKMIIRDNIWKQYQENDYGRWAIILKSTGEFTGWCGLKYRPEREAVDIGYRLDQKFWGQGIASEAAAKCLDVGFEQYDLEFIIGCAFVNNKPSVRILEKIGMTFKQYFMLHNAKSVWYEKWRDE